jgi:outer membrane lipoprotein-sorting protein
MSTMKPARRAPLTFLTMTVLLVAAGCQDGRSPADSETKANAKVHGLVREILHAYGGSAALGKVRAYRTEGILTSTQHREQGDLVRWFERPDRLRIELRYPDRGEVRVALGDEGWGGPDDRQMQPVTGSVLESLRLQAARLDLPLRLAEQESSLVRMDPDDKGRDVLRLSLDDGMFIDYHVSSKKHRIERVSMRLSAPAPVDLAADLSEFRWVHGVLFPFREDTYAGGSKTAIVRFRSVKTNPEIVPELFSPLTPP